MPSGLALQGEQGVRLPEEGVCSKGTLEGGEKAFIAHIQDSWHLASRDLK